MNYTLQQTVAPDKEPLTLSEAKTHLRIDGTEEDALISGLISTARMMAEAYTSRAMIQSTFEMKLRDFPGGGGSIMLPRTPLVSVSSVEYYDAAGTQQTLATSNYEALSNDTTAMVSLLPTKTWPETQSDRRLPVTVTFIAGYGTESTSVPQSVRSAMLMAIGHLFENREAVVTGTIATQLPMAVEALLDTVTVRPPA